MTSLQSWTTLMLVLVGITQIFAGCYPNTICDKKRDTIIQLSETILPSEIAEGGRTWHIKPSLQPFNAILAFKNFSSLVTSVLVLSYEEEEKTIKYYYGTLTDFEVVLQNVVDVIIYVPITSEDNAEFVLNYYTGCEMLSSVNDQINALPTGKFSRNEEDMVCWFVQPNDIDERKRIYFSIKDVSLNAGQQLAIWDIHTMSVIAEAENSSAYQLVAAETEEHQTVVIDLVCTRDHCSRKLNSYVVSYYAMTEEDVACIENQCDEKENITTGCNVTCPAFDNMLTMEYGTQITGAFLKKENLPDEEDEEEEEEEETRPARRRRRCPLPKPLCKCKVSVDKKAYCDEEVKCFELTQCTFACIFHKLTTCIRITILNSLKLF